MSKRVFRVFLQIFERISIGARVAVFTGFGSIALMGEPSLICIQPDVIDWNMETTWESGYFSQGRDNLEGADLSAVLVDFEENKIAGGFWFAQSTQADYEEYQAFLAYTETFGLVDVSLGVAQVQFVGTDESDQEFGLSFALNECFWGVTLGLDTYYSSEADGWFGELSLSKHLEYFENFHYELTATAGYNMGYVSDGHLGLNYAEFVWGFEYHMNPQISVIGYSAYSWAIGADAACEADRCLSSAMRYGFAFRMAFNGRG